jgi:hypothetical protein
VLAITVMAEHHLAAFVYRSIRDSTMRVDVSCPLSAGLDANRRLLDEMIDQVSQATIKEIFFRPDGKTAGDGPFAADFGEGRRLLQHTLCHATFSPLCTSLSSTRLCSAAMSVGISR